ncbi:transposase [Simiduia curdlanivorans]|uniref:Transposase n=1 Tax=Simiduia curdlanivorans TaxID=1492769 RepID=A0ABV8V6W7_9GAMM
MSIASTPCLPIRSISKNFSAVIKNKKVGRKAYPPALLLRVIFYAYYCGITFSRSIERSCKTGLKFMALAAGTTHHTTLYDVSGFCKYQLR